ncbi:Tyrosine phosphatase [Fusarium tjaetaba]|uniref:Tyrosine phosphatase n=1 Tax=Fusarium tjaetaba TaxID=1567544 RepID=A0A8H5VK82_9HYPO|nr:Tyrosine phosphatase [Fusarium tjaetaba]KAF5626461.1 Tyrosine phosphatase [Fusarium tjaetaba]
MTLSRAELESIAAVHVREPLPADTLTAAFNSEPFIPIESIINLRDLGGVPGSAIRSGYIFRSGMLDAAAADPEAMAWLAANVKTVFDLRSKEERATYPSPEISGVKFVFCERVAEYPEPKPVDFAVDDGRTAWREQLMAVIAAYKPSIRAVLEHVRDKPNEPCLFHCTAGRDRTGVMAGLLQILAGTKQQVVIFDYMLSRIGIEPARERLLLFVLANIDVKSTEEPGFWNMVSLRPSFWEAFGQGAKAEYGGWDGYVKGLGFSTKDMEIIKNNLRA